MPLNENEILILTRLLGAREFVAAADAEAASVTRLGEASELTGRRFEHANRRGFLFNQTLFTMRRLVYGATFALLGSGIAATKWGFDYNNAMQTARVALNPFFQDQQQLNQSLQRLWTIAKFSPFQIKDMTTAFRALYPAFSALGIPANQVIDMIEAITNGLAIAGKVTPQNLNRATMALQHMAFQGRLTGRLVNQLGSDGIPIFTILSKELGVTADQMHQIGALGIPASVAMRAIIHYMKTTPGYAGAAQKQSLRTLTGIWSTFKDNMSALMGSLEKGFFGRIQHNLARANLWFNQFTTTIKNATSMDDVVRSIGGTGGVIIWHQLAGAIRDAWSAFKTIVSTVMTSQLVWGTILALLIALRSALWFVNKNSLLLGTAIKILLPLFIAWVSYQKAMVLWTSIFGLTEAVTTKATKDLTFAQFLFAIASGRYRLAMKLNTAALWIYNTALWATGAAADWLAMQMAVLAISFELNPLVLLLTAAVALIAGLAILYWRWRAFRDLVNGTVSWLYSHPLVALFIPLIGQFIVLARIASELAHHLRDIVSLLGRMGSAATGGRGFSWGGVAKLGANLLNPGGALLNHFLPHFATGGSMPYNGWAVVGERGPELLRIPGGSQVTPHDQAMGVVSRARDNLRPLVVQLVLPDKRVIAEAVTDVLATSGARA